MGRPPHLPVQSPLTIRALGDGIISISQISKCRPWEVKEPARIPQLESNRARLQMQTFLPLKPVILPSLTPNCLESCRCSRHQSPTSPVFLADEITTGRQVPMDKNSCSPKVLFCVINSFKRKFGF